MKKSEALNKVMELLGVDSKDEFALSAKQPPEANRFRYVAKVNRRTTLLGSLTCESHDEGSVTVEVVAPEDREYHRNNWEVRTI